MQHSGDKSRLRSTDPGQGLAVAAEVLYLVNLMLVPGLAFLGIVWLWFAKRRTASPLARCHIAQVFSASLWAGALLVLASALAVAAGGLDSPYTWVIVILWFVTVHATLILLGVLGLVKAMGGKNFVFPLVGRRCD